MEWIEISTELEHPAPELFRLLQRAFGFLDSRDATKRAVHHFESELARLAGVHDAAILKSDPAAALAALFGRMPRARAALLKALS